MWTVTHDHADGNRLKRYSRKHPRGVASCFTNLAFLAEQLNGGITLQQAQSFGFFSTEGGNVFRIAQTSIRAAKETRLYIYAVAVRSVLYTLTIGDKDSQQADLRRCREIAASIDREEQP